MCFRNKEYNTDFVGRQERPSANIIDSCFSCHRECAAINSSCHKKTVKWTLADSIRKISQNYAIFPNIALPNFSKYGKIEIVIQQSVF
jgi:hypothetical protein